MEGESAILLARTRGVTLIPRTPTDADDLNAQASALAIRNTSSAVARVLGSAAGASSRFLAVLFLGATPADPLLLLVRRHVPAFPPSPPSQICSHPLTGEFLSTRTYKGLEPRYGMDAPAVAEDMTGRGGIARGYGYESSAGAKEEE